MSIQFSCAGCGQKLNVSEKHAGKSVRCPKCQRVVEAPPFAVEIPEHVGISEKPLSPANLPQAEEIVPVSVPLLEAADEPKRAEARGAPRRQGAGLMVGFLVGGGALLLLFAVAGVALLGAAYWILSHSPNEEAKLQAAKNFALEAPDQLKENLEDLKGIADQDDPPNLPPVKIVPQKPLDFPPAQPPQQPPDLPPAPPPNQNPGDRPIPKQKLNPLQGAKPNPEAVKDNHAGQEQPLNDLQVQTLGLDAKKLVNDIYWSRDGKAFFTLDKDGKLRRIRGTDFVEERRVDLIRRCGSLAMSAEGLVVALVDLQEVWVFNSDTLELKKRIPAPSVARAVASPASQFAVAGGDGRWDNQVSVFDLKRGKIVWQDKMAFRHACMTPDGKYLFVQGGTEQLKRFRLDNGRLIEEDSSPRIAQNGQSIAISPDSKFVCLPSGGGNYRGAPDHPPVGTYATYVYPVGNLRRPAFALQSGAYPRAVGFCPKGKYAFAQNRSKQLILFTMTGIKLREYELSQRSDDTRYFAPHPDGERLLVLTGKQLYHVRLPK